MSVHDLQLLVLGTGLGAHLMLAVHVLNGLRTDRQTAKRAAIGDVPPRTGI